MSESYSCGVSEKPLLGCTVGQLLNIIAFKYEYLIPDFSSKDIVSLLSFPLTISFFKFPIQTL